MIVKTIKEEKNAMEIKVNVAMINLFITELLIDSSDVVKDRYSRIIKYTIAEHIKSISPRSIFNIIIIIQ